MIINEYLKKNYGCEFPERWNKKAIELYCKINDINFESFYNALRESADDERWSISYFFPFDEDIHRLITCYLQIASKSILRNNYLFKSVKFNLNSTSSKTSIGERTLLSFYADENRFQIEMGFDKDCKKLTLEQPVDLNKIQQDVLDTFSLFVGFFNFNPKSCFPHFDYDSMKRNDYGYYFFSYEFVYSGFKLVFATTEKGWDLFSNIRFFFEALSTPFKSFLGEHWEMVFYKSE